MIAPKILLVEPDDILAALLLEALAEDGYRVEHAVSHKAAQCLSTTHDGDSYHLVIAPSDLAATESAGLWLERLRRQAGTMVVARAPWQSQRQTDGDATTLREPFTLDDLLNAVSALLCISKAHGDGRDADESRGAGETPTTDAVTAISRNMTPQLDLLKVSYMRARAALDQLDAAQMEYDLRGDALAEQRLMLAPLRAGDFILCAPSCPRDGCAVALFELQGRDYIRVCYGAEQGNLAVIAAEAGAGLSCPHCGVQPGQWHHIGCFFEICPLCGESLLDGCRGDHGTPGTAAAAPDTSTLMPEMKELVPRTTELRRPKPIHLTSRLRCISQYIQNVHKQTGVNVRFSVHALMTATSTLQMRETLYRVDRAELAALRLLYRMIR